MIKIKKKLISLFIIFIIHLVVFQVMNIEVSISQGVNGQTKIIKMPLYIKLSDYWVRSNHYKLLVEKILKGKRSDYDKLKAIFDWTTDNIRPIPKGFPVVDDHVDNVIIRGYGTDDQAADVFTTLATFAGYKAGMYHVKNNDSNHIHALSLVDLNNRLLLFDTYYNFIFFNKKGSIASLDEIIRDVNIVKAVTKDFKVGGKFRYTEYFNNLKPLDELGWTKADLQILPRRVIYSIGRILRISESARTFYGESY